MRKEHQLRLNMRARGPNDRELFRAKKICLPARLCRRLFGSGDEVVVIAPSRIIHTIEINEIIDGGNPHEQYESSH